MIAKSTIPTSSPLPGYELLQSGDRLDQPTFHELYQQTPDGFKAELVEGVVFVASPVSPRHGVPQLILASWLARYVEDTPGVQGFDNTTTILGEKSEPQPDLALRIKPGYGGQTTDSTEGMILGPCELVIEISNSTFSLDNHAKKRDYERAGIAEYLIILPKSRSIIWYVRDNTGFVEMALPTDGIFQSQIFPGLWLQAEAVFDETAKRIRTTLEHGLASSEHAAFVEELKTRHAAMIAEPPQPTGEPQ